MAACHTENLEQIATARDRLDILKKPLTAEVELECFANKIGRRPDGTFGSLKVKEPPASVWVTKSNAYLAAGRYAEALGLAHAYTSTDPLNMWPVIGKSACALDKLLEANLALSRTHDSSRQKAIITFCSSKGFVYDANDNALRRR